MRSNLSIRPLLIYLILSLFQHAEATDFQIWAEAYASHPLNSCWSMGAKVSARFKNDASKAYLYYVELSFARDCPNGWEVISGYREVYKRDGPCLWQSEAVPYAAVIKKIEWCDYTLFARSRVEYHSDESFWVYRQRLIFDFPQQFSPMKLQPQVYGEVFFREREGFSQYRFFAGLKRRCPKFGEMLIGYLLRELRSEGRWGRDNILLLSGLWSF